MWGWFCEGNRDQYANLNIYSINIQSHPRGLFGDNLAWLGSLWKHLSELQRTGSALGTHSEVDQEEMESVATSWAPLEYFDAVMVAGSSCDASNGND